MSQYETLNTEKHRQLRIKTGYSAALGDAVTYVMTYPMEFRDIQSCYPILFTKDPNTGNPLARHRFEGHVARRHIHILEEYEEVFPDGRREQRRNTVHYVLVDDRTVFMIADIRVDGQLLVFGNTKLTKSP